MEFKQKNQNNFLESLAEGLESLLSKGHDFFSDAKNAIEDRRVQQASIALSYINILVSTDPVLATAKFTTSTLRKMFPVKKRGYTIDYSEPYCECCPRHKCKTYRVKETTTLVWCPLCMDFLEVYG